MSVPSRFISYCRVPVIAVIAVIAVASAIALAGLAACDGRTPDRAIAAGEPQEIGFAALARQSSSLMPSLVAEHARYQGALNQELQRHLSALPQIHAASVLVAGPRCPLRSSALRDDPRKRSLEDATAWSASVIALVPPSQDRDALRRHIVDVVASGVAGVTRERVSVVMTTASHGDAKRLKSSERISLSSLGPFLVATSSKRALQVTGVVLLGSIVALALWVWFALRAHAALRARIAHRPLQRSTGIETREM